VAVRVISAARAELRLREAAAWLARPRDEALIIAANADAAAELARARPSFGVHRLGIGRVATELAKLVLADKELVPIGALATEALCARVVDRLRRHGQLGRLASVVEQPGLPRALARTLTELRMAGAAVGGELGAALAALRDELAAAKLADRAYVYELATEVARTSAHPLLGHDVLVLDVPMRTRAEQRLLAAIVARASDVLVTVPAGEHHAMFGVAEQLDAGEADALARVQQRLFAPGAGAALDDSLAIFSAPGESRECVEIARRILHAAERGVAFDRMAVLLRSPEQYRVHLEEALGRAGIPAYFERGTVLPDPSGRAFLALLACAADGLSARRFAEYVSLGEVPHDVAGAPPAAAASGDRWVPPDEDLLPLALATQREDDEPELAGGTLRAPWRWERLLVDAAVIGGRERWTRRLAGLEAQLALDDGEERREQRARMLADLGHLRELALPLLDELAALPAYANWGDWIDRLSALATRALRRPERVLAVLAGLAPMSEVGPVDLREVQIALSPRLVELVHPPTGRRYGRVLVAPIDAARGLGFDVVFVPGLAERMFPQKIIEDPLLLDAQRTGLGLDTAETRLADERLLLRLALGAARHRVVLSYPRIDLHQGRPRVPSFYGLEVLAAAEGALPGFDELGRRAEVTGAARIGWPAPALALDAIDEAEHDLALLDDLFSKGDPAATGAAHYLLAANPHLARALRTRARRWKVTGWKPADGFIATTDEGKAAMAAHAPDVRSFSPTALQQLAACPYRFVLRTIVKLEPRDVPEPIEAIGALERGSLVHEVQFELLGELREAGLLPVRAANLDAARDRLDAALDRVANRYRDRLHPAIERVWTDGIASIRADLREWLRRMTDELEWTPQRFELAFGLGAQQGRDPASVDGAIDLGIGLTLRGSIDLVERRGDGALRATDHKTGVATVDAGSVIAGGKSLQPVLYALVLEKLFPGAAIAGGRLYYCTTRGNFQGVDVPLDDDARAAARLLADTLADHFRNHFFPAAPAKDECKYCDYRPVCGPYEEMRAKKKQTGPLVPLGKLRGAR
jgi:RecB family exonuclease